MATKTENKIYELKDTIVFLYEKEGRSKNYISKLLNLNRKSLTKIINDEWKLISPSGRRINPSNKKFLNRNKQFIKSKLDQDFTIKEISKMLNVKSYYLTDTIIIADDVLRKSLNDNMNRRKHNATARKNKMIENSSLNYNYEKIDNERWEDILGYDNYQVSDNGRIRKYIKTYDNYILLSLNKNAKNGYNYIKIGDSGLKVSRLVGFAFVDGHSAENNTIEHNDNIRDNDHYLNLKWVSQGENNKLAYEKGRKKSFPHSRNGKFKEIIIDDKYRFKTIVAFAKWENVSPTQASRYISGESKYTRDIKLIY